MIARKARLLVLEKDASLLSDTVAILKNLQQQFVAMVGRVPTNAERVKDKDDLTIVMKMLRRDVNRLLQAVSDLSHTLALQGDRTALIAEHQEAAKHEDHQTALNPGVTQMERTREGSSPQGLLEQTTVPLAPRRAPLQSSTPRNHHSDSCRRKVVEDPSSDEGEKG